MLGLVPVQNSNAPQGPQAYSSASCHQQSSPHWGQAALYVGPGRRDGRTCAGGVDAAAERDSVASAAPGLAQGPWELIIRQATLWASRGKQRFHLSVSTYPFIYVAGTRERSWEPQPQKRGTLPSEESGGTGATCSPFPALAPQGSGVQSGTTWCLPSLTHSFHRYFHTKHLKGLGSERGDTAPPSKEPPGLWGDRVRSAGVQTGPARSHSPAQEDGSGCQGP